MEELGRCKKIYSYKHRTIFVGTSGDQSLISQRLREVKNLLGDPSLGDPDREVIFRRIQRLVCGIAVLRVGAPTEIELRERKDRVDDALHATQAAVEEGVLPGGGTALVKASMILEKEVKSQKMNGFRVGAEIIRHACRAPMAQIAKNSGVSSEIVMQKAMKTKKNVGYDATTDTWVDMFDAGIIDPLKVVRCALENASSTARMLLSVGCSVVDDELFGTGPEKS